MHSHIVLIFFLSNFSNKLFLKIHISTLFFAISFTSHYAHYSLQNILLFLANWLRHMRQKQPRFFIQFCPIFLFLFLHILWWLKYIIFYFRFFKKLFLLYFYYVIPYISRTHIPDISESHACISCFF